MLSPHSAYFSVSTTKILLETPQGILRDDGHMSYLSILVWYSGLILARLGWGLGFVFSNIQPTEMYLATRSLVAPYVMTWCILDHQRRCENSIRISLEEKRGEFLLVLNFN